MSKVLDFFQHFERKSYSHEVAGKTFAFFEIPFSTVLSLRKPITQIAQSISILLHNFDIEVGQHRTQAADGREEVVIMPKESDLSRQHSQARSESIGRLVGALLDKGYSESVALIILSSLRNDFKDPTATDASEFLNRATLPELVEFVIGTMKANQRLFDPFKEEAAALGARVKLRVMGDPEIATEGEPSPEETPKTSMESKDS